MRAKPPYQEGTWFAVPLLGGHFGAGLVTRMAHNGILVGYFFDPGRCKPANLSEMAGVTPDQAILIRRFADRGLIERRWPISGISTAWNRDDWPMPIFGHQSSANQRRWWKRIYADDDPRIFVHQEAISEEEYVLLPKDGLLGHLALEKVLNVVLS